MTTKYRKYKMWMLAWHYDWAILIGFAIHRYEYDTYTVLSFFVRIPFTGVTFNFYK